MTFGQDFESKFNENMQDDGHPGPAPPEFGDHKAGKKKSCYFSEPAHEDFEMHEKKDQPPRFSTIFGSAAPSAPPPPQPPREYVQEYCPRPEKKSGVFMPMPLFIVFAVILFFESTILFAYTVIGLYNNAPSRLFPWAGQGTAVAAACDCTEHQPAVNISPNFVLPQGAQPVTEKVTISITPTISTTSSMPSSTTSSTTSSSTSTADSTSQAAAIASDIAGILGSLTTSPSSSSSSPVATVTYTPPQSTVDVTMVITSDASTESAAPPPTVTLTTEVPPPSSTGAAISSRNAPASAIAANKSDPTADPIPSTTSTPTTLETSTTTPPPSTTEQSIAETSVSPPAGKVCFGGAGGVQLNCV